MHAKADRTKLTEDERKRKRERHRRRCRRVLAYARMRKTIGYEIVAQVEHALQRRAGVSK
jgi:hypothetical protein